MNESASKPGKMRSANESSGDGAGVVRLSEVGGSGADMSINGDNGVLKRPDCNTFTTVKALPIDSIKNALVDSTTPCKRMVVN